MFQIIQRLQGDHLMGHLKDRVSSLLRSVSRVGADALYAHRQPAGALSPHDDPVVRISGFKIENRRAASGRRPKLRRCR